MGLFIGFLNLIPYMQAIGFIPTILLALLKANETGESFWLIMLGACIVFIVVQSIEDAFLVPKIMGKLMGLNPAVILLALSVWGLPAGIHRPHHRPAAHHAPALLLPPLHRTRRAKAGTDRKAHAQTA